MKAGMSNLSVGNLINHVVFVVDGSGSMQSNTATLVKVFDEQVKWLAEHSTSMGQETRVSTFVFNTDGSGTPNIRCLVYDKDVLRLPSLVGLYSPDGGTPLIDATLAAIQDLGETPQHYGDHAFLVYVLTDGEENRSKNPANALGKAIRALPDNWTVAVLVPNQNGVFLAKQFGFPPDNIAVWDATSTKGLEAAGSQIRNTTSTFFSGRAKGIRGTKNLFKVDTSSLSRSTVRANLEKVKTGYYVILPVKRDATIRDFVEAAGYTFFKGCAHYLLTKPETVQGYKGIYVYDRKTDSLYTGENAREMLGLPLSSAKVVPGDFCDFDIFIQSTSVNRRLVGGTKLLVML
jgi:hypothetical protein